MAEGQMENADVRDRAETTGDEYDKARLARVQELDNATEEDGEGRAVQPGAVVTGTNARGDLVTQFPGAAERGLASSVDDGDAAARAAKGLDTENIAQEDSTWTAQSAVGYVGGPEGVPGQTYTLEQLPDPNVVNGSGLPAHTIPADLVVDAVVTDDINASQEAGGDVATAPRHAQDSVPGTAEPVTAEAEAGTPADVADGTEDAKKGGRAAGRKAAKAE